MSIHGIDVSSHQGEIDWERVKDSGVQFAMLRAGYGSGHEDGQFRRNASECNRIGLPFGVYWFSYAYNEGMARREAADCIRTIREYEVHYPVCMDFEYASVNYAAKHGVRVGRALATAIVETFCKKVEEEKYFAMYYSNLDYMRRMLEPELKETYALWYAQYASEPSATGMALWQYRDNGRVDGISGRVDMDIAYYDLARVISKAGFNHLSREAGTPHSATAEPNEVREYTIRRGDTLTKIAEKYGTTAAALAKFNHIMNPNKIYVGEILLIPIGHKK